MSEVTEFISTNPDMGPVFQEFATRYSSLAEVWDNCPHSGWMLWILYKRKYRNAEKLERYIKWLRKEIQLGSNQNLADLRLREFDAHRGWTAEQVEIDLKAGKISQARGRYLRFIGAWSMALHGTALVLDEKVVDALWDKIGEEIEHALAGRDLHVPDVDETKIRLTGLREQADKLREFVGNPFAPERAEDFYYGRGQIG